MLGFLRRVGGALLGKNAAGPLRGDLSSALVTQDAHARFQEALLNGQVFIGSDLAGTAVTTQAGLSATTPALTLYNPLNSPVNLVVWSLGCAFQAAPAAAAAVMLAVNLPIVAASGAPTAPIPTTLAQIFNADLYSQIIAAPVGQCYRVCTLAAAPIACRQCFGTTGAAAIGGMYFRDPIDGAIIVPPGVALSVQTSSAASVVCDIVWEEVPFNQ